MAKWSWPWIIVRDRREAFIASRINAIEEDIQFVNSVLPGANAAEATVGEWAAVITQVMFHSESPHSSGGGGGGRGWEMGGL